MREKKEKDKKKKLICPNNQTFNCSINHLHLLLSVSLGGDEKLKLFHYLAYFCYYSWVSLHFLALFIGITVLF